MYLKQTMLPGYTVLQLFCIYSLCFTYYYYYYYYCHHHHLHHHHHNYHHQCAAYLKLHVCRCSSFAIATELRAGRSGDRIPVGTRFSAPVQTGPGAHPTSCKMGTRSFPGVKCGRGVLLTTHHLPVPRSCNSRGIPLPTLWVTPGL